MSPFPSFFLYFFISCPPPPSSNFSLPSFEADGTRSTLLAWSSSAGGTCLLLLPTSHRCCPKRICSASGLSMYVCICTDQEKFPIYCTDKSCRQPFDTFFFSFSRPFFPLPYSFFLIANDDAYAVAAARTCAAKTRQTTTERQHRFPSRPRRGATLSISGGGGAAGHHSPQ